MLRGSSPLSRLRLEVGGWRFEVEVKVEVEGGEEQERGDSTSLERGVRL